MKVLCSYCSAAKSRDEGPLAAVQRYDSDRLCALHRRGVAEGTPLHILSGRYGLLASDEPIPWYDHLLGPSEVAAMSGQVARSLRSLGVTTVEYHTASVALVPQVGPYLEVMRAACAEARVALVVVELDGDPA